MPYATLCKDAAKAFSWKGGNTNTVAIAAFHDLGEIVVKKVRSRCNTSAICHML